MVEYLGEAIISGIALVGLINRHGERGVAYIPSTDVGSNGIEKFFKLLSSCL